jgi:hypothetical protein
MIMTERDTSILRFLRANQWCDEHRKPLAGDASFRRYERLLDADRRAVLMDAPPEKEEVRPFWAIAHYLRGAGYSAPEITAVDLDASLLLLEDLGDDLFSRVVRDDPQCEVPLYEAAVDFLIDLHGEPAPSVVGLPDGSEYPVPAYSEELLLSEAMLFVDWYLPEIQETRVTSTDRRAFTEIWKGLFGQIPQTPKVLVLRDYQADNLIWLPQRAGVARVGLLDFQDAVIGSPVYDLVSLLEDARRDVAPSLAAAMIERYLDKATKRDSSFDAGEFRSAYRILGAQRNTKIIGIFARLWKRDGKPGYLDLIPRVWGLLGGDLAHPALTEARDWFDGCVPSPARSAGLDPVR